MSHYSSEVTEPAIPDDPGVKVYNRFVTLKVQLVHTVLDIFIDIVTDRCVHRCNSHDIWKSLKLFCSV